VGSWLRIERGSAGALNGIDVSRVSDEEACDEGVGDPAAVPLGWPASLEDEQLEEFCVVVGPENVAASLVEIPGRRLPASCSARATKSCPGVVRPGVRPTPPAPGGRWWLPLGR
jgi:hypothetical protein